MSKKQDRIDRLLPNGEPRWVRIYDAEDEFIDRYTVIFSGNYTGRNGQTQILGMSAEPTYPQGVCLHTSYYRPIDNDKWGFHPKVGQKIHLGKRIEFKNLPKKCKEIVLQDYKDIWGINEMSEGNDPKN